MEEHDLSVTWATSDVALIAMCHNCRNIAIALKIPIPRRTDGASLC
jgi:hypothetical protein